MRAEDIRRNFLSFFAERQHQVVPSASLIPADATVMFAVAGMVQFAPYFLGSPAPHPRAASIQKCMRAGGKLNDLEEVGHTPIHHTFFEMAGNFSFGDYFKPDAIRFAWDLLTGPFGIDPDRIWVTVHVSDDEAEQIWREQIGLAAAKINRLDKENFWSMGGAGPCGPSSEIFVDRGPDYGPAREQGPLDDERRYPEVWNLVFMQYTQDDDGNITGELARKGIDTGMGFERMASVLQDVPTNYDTDVFVPIMQRAEQITGARRDGPEAEQRLLKILSDHARSLTFLVADGVMPSNEGRGYVLRRILRRAVTKARLAGVTDPVLAELCKVVVDLFGSAYPEVMRERRSIVEIASLEEQRFARTLEAGLSLLQAELQTAGGVLPGQVAFRLHDTYGFPLEITQDVAKDHGIEVDQPGFEAAMLEQRERSRADTHAGKAGDVRTLDIDLPPAEFVGFEGLEADTRVLAVLQDLRAVSAAPEGQEAELVLDATPFYPEGGGQVGDRGWIQGGEGSADVLDSRRHAGVIVLRVRVTSGRLQPGDDVRAIVDPRHRAGAEQAHTATHMLHHVLRESLGEHVRQMGSLVEPGRLRFDFSHFSGLTPDQLAEIEELINTRVEDDDGVRWFETGYREAVEELGAMHFFEEKYGDVVRVVEVGDYSRELCGGTHVRQTGRIGLVKVLGEGSIGSNLRRVQALTGTDGLRWVNERLRQAERAAELARVSPEQLASGVERLLATQKDLQKALEAQERDRVQAAVEQLIPTARTAGSGRLVSARRSEDSGTLRKVAVAVRDRLDRCVVILGSAGEGGANIVAAASPSLVSEGLDVRAILRPAAAHIGGGAGGKENLASAGGRNTAGLDEALAAAAAEAEGVLSA
ncbi:MAG TPA: alanine--tRNA ligase [Actinomycetota bacterium]|nr:alanine--tRNA ligase [Actinomycetota bacterium]